jgi:hypothetical protein
MNKQEAMDTIREVFSPFVADCCRRLDALEATRSANKGEKITALKAQVEELAATMQEIKSWEAKKAVRKAESRGFAGVLGANRHVRTLNSPDAGSPFRGSILPHVEKGEVVYDTSGLPSALASGSLNNGTVKKSDGDGDFSGMDNLMFGCPWS